MQQFTFIPSMQRAFTILHVRLCRTRKTSKIELTLYYMKMLSNSSNICYNLFIIFHVKRTIKIKINKKPFTFI